VVRGGAQRLKTLAVVSTEPHSFSLAPCRHLARLAGGWKRFGKDVFGFFRAAGFVLVFLFAFVAPAISFDERLVHAA
jgi:hypothetical protein